MTMKVVVEISRLVSRLVEVNEMSREIMSESRLCGQQVVDIYPTVHGDDCRS